MIDRQALMQEKDKRKNPFRHTKNSHGINPVAALILCCLLKIADFDSNKKKKNVTRVLAVLFYEKRAALPSNTESLILEIWTLIMSRWGVITAENHTVQICFSDGDYGATQRVFVWAARLFFSRQVGAVLHLPSDDPRRHRQGGGGRRQRWASVYHSSI